MRSHAVTCVALACTACTAAPDTDSRTQPIIGGQTTTPDEYPAVVATENGPGNWGCTGTLIHPQWVLTAAHCVEGETAASLQVRFDDADINDTEGGFVVELAAIHAHPGFDDDLWDNDIAVLELAMPVTDRAPTPVHRAAIAAGTTLTQVGYGDVDDNGNGDGILRELTTENVPCADADDPEVSDDNLLCFAAGDGTATCYGDSGGPTYLAGDSGLEVVGVNSGGTEDLCDDGFDLQTSVAAELDFVDQYVPIDDGGGDDGDDDGDGDGDGDADGDPGDDGGCAASRGGGGLTLVLLALAACRRRRAPN